MSTRPFHSFERIEDLRRAFDQAFSSRPNGAVQDLKDLISVRIAGDPYAIRVGEMAGLAASPRIIPVPSTVAELLGIMAIRGVVIPVYSLAEILGYGKDHDPMRWVSLFGTHQPLGFTFESLEGYVRIPSADLWISEEMKVARKHVCQVARIGTLTRPVVSLASAAQTIKGQAGLVGLQKEQ